MSQNKAKAKPKEEKPKKDDKLTKEIEERVKAENKALKEARAEALAKRKYVPKPGTGKHFHVLIEQPQFNSKTARKISEPVTQLMDANVFTQWLKSAARLGFCFALKHDASIFLPASKQDEIKKLISEYEKALNPDLLEYNKILKGEE